MSEGFGTISHGMSYLSGSLISHILFRKSMILCYSGMGRYKRMMAAEIKTKYRNDADIGKSSNAW